MSTFIFDSRIFKAFLATLVIIFLSHATLLAQNKTIPKKDSIHRENTKQIIDSLQKLYSNTSKVLQLVNTRNVVLEETLKEQKEKFKKNNNVRLWLYVIVIGGFWAIAIIIIFLLWLLVKLIFSGHTKKSKRIIHSFSILLGFIFASPLTAIWLDLFNYTGLIDSEFSTIGLILTNTYKIFPLFNIAYFINCLLGYFFWYGALSDTKDKSMVPDILIRIVNGISYTIASIIAVAIIAPNAFNNVLLSIGTTGVVGAFLAKEPVKKAFLALSLNLGKSYREGDIITIEGITGKIDEIGWNTVKLITLENNKVIFPNAKLTNSIVTNTSQPNEKKVVSLNISLNPNISPERIKRLLKKSAMDSKHVEIMAKSGVSPKIHLTTLNHFTAIYTIEVTTTSQNLEAVKSDILSAIWYMLRREGLKPVPKQWAIEDPVGKAIQLMNAIDILAPFNEEEELTLAKGGQWIHYGYPEKIITQGDFSASLYIIAEGEVNVMIEKNKKWMEIAQLKKHDFFGEMSLLTGESNSATVQANSEVLILKIDKDILEPILINREVVMEELSIKLAKRQIDTHTKSQAYDEKQAKEAEDNMAKKLLSLMKGLVTGKNKNKKN